MQRLLSSAEPYQVGFKTFCAEYPEALLIEDYRAGDQICSDCGLVVGDRVIDVGSKWRTFSREADADPDAEATGSESFAENGAAKYQNRTMMRRSDRAFLKALKEISSVTDKIHLQSTIVERAKHLFK